MLLLQPRPVTCISNIHLNIVDVDIKRPPLDGQYHSGVLGGVLTGVGFKKLLEQLKIKAFTISSQIFRFEPQN